MGKGGTAVFDTFEELENHVKNRLEAEQLEDALKADKREQQRRQEMAIERGHEYRGFDEPPPVLRTIQKATAVKQRESADSVKREIAKETVPHMRERISHQQSGHIAWEKHRDVKMAAAKKPAAPVPQHDDDLAHQRKPFVHQHQSRSFVPKFRDVFGPKKH
jgi:ribosomal protein S21